MPGFLDNIEILEENIVAPTGFNPDFLQGNIFQKITATIDVRFETWFNCLLDEEITFADKNMRTSDWISDLTIGTRFDHFAVGDQIEVSNASTGAHDGDYLISEKRSDGLIRVTDTLGSAVTLTYDFDSSAIFTLIQDPQGFVFDYGLPTNTEGFSVKSKVDNNIMRYELGVVPPATYLPTSATSMDAVGKKSWQLGEVTVNNNTTSGQRDNGEYYYQIIHIFYIHPFYLPKQINDIWDTTNKVISSRLLSPSYFKYQECLKYCTRLRAHRQLTDPNVYQELIIDNKKGQTGWFNEEYNGGTPEYSLASITYNNTIGKLTRDDTVSVTVVLDAVNLVPEYCCVNFIMLPEDDADYQENGKLMLKNYVFDRAYQTQGAGSINGENTASNPGYEVLQSVTVAVDTPIVGQTQIDFDVTFGSDAKTVIDNLANKNYLIAIYAVDNASNAQYSNYVTVLCDVNEIAVEIPAATLTTVNEILFHDQNDNSVVSNDHEIKVEDEIVVDSLLTLDRSSLDVQIDTINVQIIATDGTEEAILEDYPINLINEPEINDVRFINKTITDPFNVGASEIRKEIKVYRSVSQDSGSSFAYRVQYPFLMRWEYWEQLLLTSLPADFYDASQDFNGYNQDWIRLGSLSGWGLVYRVLCGVSVGSTTTNITTDEALVEKDYSANASEWDTPLIETFDGATQIDVGGDPYIMTNKRTKVEMSFNYIGGGSPDETTTYMVARLYPKENGTYIKNDSFSSVWDREGLGAWTSNDGSSAGAGKIVLTKNASTFTGTLYIDHTKLPAGVTEYSVSWSINRDTATSRPDWGEVHTQDVLAIPEIIEEPEIDLADNPFKLCCYPLKVFATLAGTDPFKNDFVRPIKAFGTQYTVVMTLQKYTSGSWSDVGVLSNQVSRTKNNLTYYGHLIEWTTYLNSDGEGKYRVEFDFGGSFMEYSEEWCLYTYSQRLADETVRFEYTWNSVIGDEIQTKTRDFVGMDWTSQIRLCDSVFYGRHGSFEKESVRMQSGEERAIKKTFREEYVFELRGASMTVHKALIYGVLMADKLLVCDYNSKNADEFVDVSIEINSGYEPNYSGSRELPSVELGFVDKYDNRQKKYS